MIKTPRSPLIAIILIIYILLARIALARTPVEEEWEVLNLFYKPDELVVSATHYPKPVSQVAENISIVTAEDIQAMNAHSVAEVLNRIPGVFLGGYDRNFGAVSNISIQGSSNYHTLVLVDGVRWNMMGEGHAETTNIPPGIIERIEVVKGPASSAWGSSLGGVVNIITKGLSEADDPWVEGYASYGERNTSDLRAEGAGQLGSARLYAFAGRMDSDGLRANRSYENNQFYSKIQVPLREALSFGFSAGYSEPDLSFGSLPDYDLSSSADFNTFFTTAFVDATITRNLSLNLATHFLKNRFSRDDRVLNGDWWYLNQPGDVLQSIRVKDEKWGGGGKLTWKGKTHTALLGLEFEQGALEDGTNFSPGYDVNGYAIDPNLNTRAVYFNDTVVMHPWALTPGIRYDHNSISGDFVSPSLGATRLVSENLLLRAMIARGFTSPPLTFTSGGGLFLVPNPNLKPENITSCQFGMEAGVAEGIRINTTLFHHKVKDVFFKKWDALGPFMDQWINAGSATRQGFEFVIHTAPFEHFSYFYGATYVHQSPETNYGAKDQISLNVKFTYENPDFLQAQLMGHYLRWDEHPDLMGEYEDTLWDMHISKPISLFQIKQAHLFVTGHNLFNGSLYTDPSYKNPGRWFETGVRMTF
jgi:vitamin B12 transporter